jgi:endoglucanase
VRSPGARPDLRINQLGYLPTGPKRAVWVSDAREPVEFRVRDGGGAEVLGGRTRPWPAHSEPTSGLDVHVLHFSDLRAEGERFAIDAARAPGYGRPAGHPGDASVEAWSGPEAERLYPGWSCPGRFDVSGGWYDAGDHGKYVTSGAMPVWQLLATVELIRRRRTRTAWWARTEALILEECRWQLDWLLKMQAPPGALAGGPTSKDHPGLPRRRAPGRPATAAPLPRRAHV